METLQRLATSRRHERLTLKLESIQGSTAHDSLKIVLYDRVESTNSVVYQLGENRSPEWTVATAAIQTKGRGRRGNRWESPKGGLWFSILLRPGISPDKTPLLQFLAGIAAREALQNATGLRIMLKWPNDLVTENGKLGGILVESKIQADRLVFAVVGAGINVNLRRSQLPIGATSIQLATGRRYDLHDLLNMIIRRMKSKIRMLDDPKSIMKEWWDHCIHRPPQVIVTTENDTLAGISRGIDDDGALIIETEDHRTHKVNEGSLRLLDDSKT